MLTKLTHKIIRSIGSFLALLFGKFAWTTPPWMQYLHQQSITQPKKFWSSVAFLLVGIAMVLYGYSWYLSLPQPERVVIKTITPGLTTDAKQLLPKPLVLRFGILSQGQFMNKPVAPLQSVGKTVSAGIALSPQIKGSWKWETDSRLLFTPETDWPANETYSIDFAKDFFTSGTKMENWHTSFTTRPFSAQIKELKFYQDPLDPQLRQVVATLTFSHPVEPESLESHVQLTWQTLHDEAEGPPFKFTLRLAENKRRAYLHSGAVPLPQTERFITLTLHKGIQPLAGAESDKTVQANVLVPDAGSYFKIVKTAAGIVRDPQDRPQQVLTVETTLGVTEQDLSRNLHVYLLPTDRPATATEDAKPHYPWQGPGEVNAAILKLSTPLSLQPIPAERDFATLHSYSFNQAHPGYLYLKLDQGIRGFGGFTLAHDYTAVLRAPAYPQEIRFLHKGALLALGTEEKLSVLVRGLNAVKFEIARVLPDDVNHLVTQTAGDFSNPYFITYYFNRNNISELFSQIVPFAMTDPAKEQYTALDLSHYLATRNNPSGPLGLFLLRAMGWDLNNNRPLGVENNRLILITDLGVIVKDNRNETHDVFVQSITQGSPVNQAVVEILGKNGLPILSRTTDAQGHVAFPSLKDFTNDREATVYLVRKGNDVAFIPYYRADRQLNYSRFDVGGITSNNNENQAALTAYLFSDRGVYRPGETAHIGMIVKQPYALAQPAGLPLKAIIMDPRGATVKDVQLTLDDSGYLSLDFATTPTAATGAYFVYLYIVKDHRPSSLLGSTMLQVAEFLPDRLRISAHLSHEQAQGWVSPVDLTTKVNLWNLYGAPAANHRIAGKMLLSPKPVMFKKYPDYIFIDPLFNPQSPPKVFTDTLSETKTDAQGQAELALNLARFAKATYELTVFVQGFEAQGGRSVATQVSTLVSPLAFLVGYKADGDLNYIKQNADRQVHFIAIDPALNQRALGQLKLQLFRQRPISTLVKKADGTYQYQSILQTSQITSTPFTLPAQGADYHLMTENIGDFLVTVVDDHGVELSRFKYSVVGSGALPLPKNAELNVKLNKTEYAPHENIEMQITAPYTGTGLLSIERDKVYAYQWFKTDTTASVQKIPLPQDLQGNGYVNIDFVRDINSPEIFMSPLSYSVSPFAVTHQDQTLQINLSAPSLVEPGGPLTITYQSDKPGKIIVFAVDEGILQVARYQTPDPLQFFFAKRALEVTTSQIVDQILPQFIAARELSAVGGDEGRAELVKNLNPFKRQTEAPVAYWSGILDTDTTPRQLVYSVPDYFNGSLRIMAVGVATNAVGAATKTAEVRGPFVINPNVPTFVSPGDEFDVTASVANNVQGSGPQAKIALGLSVSSQLEIMGPAHQTLVVPEKQERSVHFKLRAKSQLGSAGLLFTAAATWGNQSSQLSSTLSVRPASPFSVSLRSGYTQKATLSLPLDRVLYPEYRTVNVLASPSPLMLVTGLQHYLQDYPYGCIEQLVSKALPWLALAKQPFASDTQKMNERVDQTIQLLSQRQTANGDFDFWPGVGTTPNNDFASVYAVHFLTEAREQGYNVPRDVLVAGLQFLRELATKPIANLNDARLHAYAIYVLTRNEIVTTNYLTNLQYSLDHHPEYHWQQDILNMYIAATYQLLKNSADAEKILRHYQSQMNNTTALSTDFYNDFYTQDTIRAQYLYLLARHFPNQITSLNQDVIMSLVAALNSTSMSTVLAGYTSLALAAYAPYTPAITGPDLKMTAKLADDKEQNLATTVAGQNQSTSLEANVRSVEIDNPNRQGYFYQLAQAGFDQKTPDKAISQQIEVYRDYTTTEGQSINEVGLGDEVVVHLRIRSLDNQYHDNIVIVDLLPGGFEVVRNSVNLGSMDFVDMREDRVNFFGSVGPESKEITYHIKATNTGTFVIPPIYAVDMYNPNVQSMGTAGEMRVINPWAVK